VKNGLNKVVVILGPTASGKTDLALRLAKEFNGEIISVDSRQVYTKMNIGTAKPEGKWKTIDKEKKFIVDGIPHYAMDIVDPGKTFTLADFQQLAFQKIKDITSRKKVPFLVGGTGLYVWAVVDNLVIPKRPPIKKLRLSFESKSIEELLALLESVDPEAFVMVDKKNKRRLIRALEVAISTGESFTKQRSKSEPVVEALQIGLSWPLSELYERINRRSEAQWKNGLCEEVKSLLKQRYSFDLPSLSGIGYRQVGYYLRGESNEKEVLEIIKRDTRRYAKRQLTWFRRDKRINWINKTDYEKSKKLIKEFLQKK
jgi:tRNA dimethylallyltransferase